MVAIERSWIVGRLTLDACLADQGRIKVHRGFDSTTGQRLVIRFLRDADPVALGELERLSRALLRHPHPVLLPIVEVGTHQGRGYWVTPELPLISVDQMLSRGIPTPLPLSLRILAMVGDGLEHAHRMGLSHGALRPANVHLAPDGRVLLTELGFAHWLDAAVWPLGATGVPPSPPQTSDLDALAVLNQLLLARRPSMPPSAPAIPARPAGLAPVPSLPPLPSMPPAALVAPAPVPSVAPAPLVAPAPMPSIAPAPLVAPAPVPSVAPLVMPEAVSVAPAPVPAALVVPPPSQMPAASPPPSVTLEPPLPAPPPPSLAEAPLGPGPALPPFVPPAVRASAPPVPMVLPAPPRPMPFAGPPIGLGPEARAPGSDTLPMPSAALRDLALEDDAPAGLYAPPYVLWVQKVSADLRGAAERLTQGLRTKLGPGLGKLEHNARRRGWIPPQRRALAKGDMSTSEMEWLSPDAEEPNEARQRLGVMAAGLAGLLLIGWLVFGGSSTPRPNPFLAPPPIATHRDPPPELSLPPAPTVRPAPVPAVAAAVSSARPMARAEPVRAAARKSRRR